MSQAIYLISTTGTPKIKEPERYSHVFRDYLARALCVHPEQRPSAAEILQHPFFQKAEPLKNLGPLSESSRERQCPARTSLTLLAPSSQSSDSGQEEVGV